MSAWSKVLAAKKDAPVVGSNASGVEGRDSEAPAPAGGSSSNKGRYDTRAA